MLTERFKNVTSLEIKFVIKEQLQNTPQLTPSLNLLLPKSAVRSRLARLYVCTKC